MIYHTDKPQEEVFFDKTIQIERKAIRVKRCKNHLGELIRIKESGFRMNSIVFPADGLKDFIELLQQAK
jgi:hypothetical protein